MDTISLTYDEIADRLGITGASARNLVRRKRWARTKGNDGKTRVVVPLEALNRAISSTPDRGIGAPINCDLDMPHDVGARVLIARLEAELAAAREMAAVAHAQADAVGRRLDDLMKERDAWREQAQALAAARSARWWHRLVS